MYVDVAVSVVGPVFEYSPAHTFALASIAEAGKLLLPPGLISPAPEEAHSAGGVGGASPPLAWWDAGRCMVHGKFDATVLGGEVVGVTCRRSCTLEVDLYSSRGLVSFRFRTCERLGLCV